MPPRRTLALCLAALAAAPLPAQDLLSLRPGLPAPEARGLVLAQAGSEDLVQVFADYYRRHPIGSTLAPSTLRVLSAGETAGLPALPSGQRYAETEGLIVRIDAAYKLLGIARRAPAATAQAPEPEPAPEPAPEPTGGANANANANATVNITINEADDDEEDEEDDGDRSQAISVAEAEARGIRIPGGHRPERGACRLWFPGTPPGRQPRGEVSCNTDDIPEGALLIRG